MTAATQRSLMEYLTVSRFYLEINNNTRLLISKAIAVLNHYQEHDIMIYTT